MKTTHLLTVAIGLSFWILYQAHGQSRQNIDSLNHLISVKQHDSTRMKIYGQLCWAYAGTRDKLDSAQIYADSIKMLAERSGEERKLIYAYFYMGTIARHAGNLAEALDYFEKYVRYHETKENTKLVATGLYQLAVILSRMGYYDEAMDSYYRVLKIHEANNYAYGVGFTLNSIAGLQRTLQNYDDAISSYYKAIAIFQSLNEEFDLAMSLENLGSVLAETNQYDSAIVYFQRALAIDTRLGKKFGIASELENMGSLYLKMGEPQKALEFQMKSLKIRKELPQLRELSQSLNKVGTVFAALKSYVKSKEYLEQSLDLSKKIGARPLVLENYQQLAKVHEAEKDYYQANEYNKQYGLLKDSLLNEAKLKQISELETRYKTAEKDQQIVLLSKENELKEAKAKQQAILRNALLGIIGLLAVVGFLIFYGLRQKLRNQKALAAKSEELKTSNYHRKLSELEMKALRSQMNPHFIFNCMNSINRMILSGKNEEAARYLTKFSKLIRLTLENSEKALIPVEDELSMLEAYIQLESIRFKGKINYDITVDDNLDQSSILLPSMVLQPFIENAIWHGLMHKKNPGTIHIKLFEEGDQLNCTIEDDGVGREMALKLAERSEFKKKSMGLKITEERLKLIGLGTQKDWIQIIDLKDPFDQAIGTRVNISIPLN